MSDEVNKAPVYAEPEGIDYIIIKVKESVINGERDGSLYETTRRAWRAKLESAMPYKYVLSVVGGIVKEVYHVTRWYTSPTDAARIEFEGEVAEFNVRNLFVGKMIPECYRQKGLASPFLYKKKAGGAVAEPAQEETSAADALKAAALKKAEEAAIKAKAEAQAQAAAAAALAKAEAEAKTKAEAEARAKASSATKCEDNGDGKLVLKQGSNKLFFKIVEDHAEVVSEYDGMWDEEPQGEVTIPDTVTDGNKNYKVTVISRLAFANCTKLTKVNLPRECSKVDEKAFYGCTGLQSIDFKNVSTIGKSAFQDCTSLQSIDFKNVSTIGKSTFSSCNSLTKVIIPSRIKEIPSRAFTYCRKLEKVIIPTSVEKIGEDAFWYCEALGNVVIPNKQCSIDSGAFTGIKGQVIR